MYGNNLLLNLGKTFLNRFFFYKSLKKHLKELKPDIIESFDWSGPLLFKIKDVRLIVRLHGSNTANNDYMEKKRSVLFTFIEKRALKIADSVVSVSNHIAEQTKKSFQLDFDYKTIYNGVDLNKFKDLKIERDINKIVLVGRMHDYKGLKELFAALDLVFESNDQVYFEIICKIIDDYKNELLSRVDKKFHNRIHFIGRVENNLLPQKYNQANLSILPSLTEAFPIIPLESMACGTPVIMSNRFSSQEIISSGRDGFLVNVIDPNKLAYGILEAISDQNKIEQMRYTAINKISNNFTIDKIFQENLKFYHQILKK